MELVVAGIALEPVVAGLPEELVVTLATKPAESTGRSELKTDQILERKRPDKVHVACGGMVTLDLSRRDRDTAGARRDAPEVVS